MVHGKVIATSAVNSVRPPAGLETPVRLARREPIRTARLRRHADEASETGGKNTVEPVIPRAAGASTPA